MTHRFPSSLPGNRSCALLLLVAMLSAFSLPGYGASKQSAVDAATELNYPPFSVASPDGQADGFAVELMRASLQEMGREVTFKMAPWHEIKGSLAEGAIDALPLVARTAERDQVFDFSVPYLTMSGVIVVRKDDRRIHSAADLRDRAVLVMRDDIAEEYVRTHHLSDRIFTTQTVEDALRRLAAGEHDAVVVQKLVGQKLVRDLGLDGLRLLDPPLPDYQTFSFAVQAGNAELLAILNEGLALAIADGTYDRLQSKWLAPLRGEDPFPLATITATVAGTLLLAWSIAWLWQGSLRRQVQARTAELSEANARLAQGEALRESEERLRMAANAARFGTFDFDFGTGEARVSDQMRTIVGLPPGAPVRLGANSFAFVHPEDRVSLLRDIAAARHPAHSGVIENEHRVVHPDQTVHRVSLRAKALPPLEGNVHRRMRMVGTVIDVTQHWEMQKALQEREADLRRAQALGRIGSWRWYVERDELVWSDETHRIFGIPKGTPLSYERFMSCVHPEDHAYVDRHWKAALDGAPYDIEHRIIVAGEVRWVREQAELEFGPDGRLRAGFGTTQDITGRKQTEEALRRESEKLQRVNADLEEFTAVASHDLKAPLRGVSNLAYLVEEDLASNVDDENRKRLGLLSERVQRMSHLIDRLLRYARAGRSQSARVAVPLDRFLEKLLRHLDLNERFSVEWTTPLPTLTADPVHLEQIFQNLLVNAVHHHDRDAGTISFEAHDEGSVWLLELADDGPGIPQWAREQVFRMFTSDGGEEHTGIGLAVVRKLVLANGGQIDVVDNVPRGARFRIRWPKDPM